MAALKPSEIAGFLRKPDPAIRILLVYGPDRGLVSERAGTFAKASGIDLADPFSTVRLDASELSGAPGRLADELYTVPMFGGERLVWIRNAGNDKGLVEALKQAAADPPRDARLVVEAGDLKKGTGIRAIVEAAKSALAMPCYSDNGRDLDQLIDAELSRHGLGISLGARQVLKDNLGGDRLASRGEIEKLCLYAAGKAQITEEDVAAIVGDASALSQDSVIDAVLAGDLGALDDALARFAAASQPESQLLGGLLRQLHQLEMMRSEMDTSGRPAMAVVKAARPPVYFAREELLARAVQRWPVPAIRIAALRVENAILDTRRNAALARPIAGTALLAIAVQASRSGRS